MHYRMTDAGQLSYEDDDVESLAILLLLERKTLQVFSTRLPQTS
jgi:hypothetical protein